MSTPPEQRIAGDLTKEDKNRFIHTYICPEKTKNVRRFAVWMNESVDLLATSQPLSPKGTSCEFDLECLYSVHLRPGLSWTLHATDSRSHSDSGPLSWTPSLLGGFHLGSPVVGVHSDYPCVLTLSSTPIIPLWNGPWLQGWLWAVVSPTVDYGSLVVDGGHWSLLFIDFYPLVINDIIRVISVIIISQAIISLLTHHTLLTWKQPRQHRGVTADYVSLLFIAPFPLI